MNDAYPYCYHGNSDKGYSPLRKSLLGLWIAEDTSIVSIAVIIAQRAFAATATVVISLPGANRPVAEGATTLNLRASAASFVLFLIIVL